MAESFENLVRPNVSPDFRPAPAQPVAPQDSPDIGKAFLTGSGGQVIKLTLSEHASWSRQKAIEKQRTYHKVRIPYTRPDGTLDWSRWTEIEVMDEVDFLDGLGVDQTQHFAEIEVSDNYQIVGGPQTRKNPKVP